MTEEERRATALRMLSFREHGEFVCEQCHKTFTARKSEKNPPRYCSDACRYKAYVPIRKAKRQAAKRSVPPADLTTPPRPQEATDA
jgi:hypothetical protein